MTTVGDFRRLAATNGVLVATGTSPDAIFGFDLSTGMQRWRVLSGQGSASLDFGSVSADGNVAYVVFTSGRLGVYDLQTGNRNSLLIPPTGFFINAPVFAGDTLFLGGFEAAYAIRK